ncbi:MAG: hypothetical protein HY520_03210 [Candidatus Aenigmarchaeota archaeon]|nr:hypothetical protein [Candidatus Aenigmarchaeota archaeon]
MKTLKTLKKPPHLSLQRLREALRETPTEKTFGDWLQELIALTTPLESPGAHRTTRLEKRDALYQSLLEGEAHPANQKDRGRLATLERHLNGESRFKADLATDVAGIVRKLPPEIRPRGVAMVGYAFSRSRRGVVPVLWEMLP